MTPAEIFIEENLKTKNTTLVLGLCNITDLQTLPRLFECTHLENLVLTSSSVDIADFGETKIMMQYRAFENQKENEFTQLPDDFKKLTNLKYLSLPLSKSLVKGGYAILKELPNLTTLYLEKNQWEDVDLSFLHELPHLEHLSFGSKVTNVMLEFLRPLISLRKLHFEYGGYSDLSPLENLTNLTHLKIGGGLVTDPSPIAGLKNLVHLDLELFTNKCDHKLFPWLFSRLIALQHLTFSEWLSDINFLVPLINLKSVDLRIKADARIEPLQTCYNLEALRLHLNAGMYPTPPEMIERLKEDFNLSFLSRFKNLSTLELDTFPEINVSQLPDALKNLKLGSCILKADSQSTKILENLESINLVVTTLQIAPASLELPRLKEAILYWTNQLQQLPDCGSLEKLQLHCDDASDLSFMRGCKKLTSFELRLSSYKDGLKKPVDTDSIKNLHALEELSLSDHNLKNCQDLKALTKLKSLELSNGPLESLSGVETMSNLEVISVSGNKLESLVGIENLKNLENVNVHGNKLKSLDGLENLTNLEVVIVSGNKLSDISILFELKKLRVLNIGNNSIKEFDPKWLSEENMPALRTLYFVGSGIRIPNMSIRTLYEIVKDDKNALPAIRESLLKE